MSLELKVTLTGDPAQDAGTLGYLARLAHAEVTRQLIWNGACDVERTVGEDTAGEQTVAVVVAPAAEPAEKRPRGRPRKDPLAAYPQSLQGPPPPPPVATVQYHDAPTENDAQSVIQAAPADLKVDPPPQIEPEAEAEVELSDDQLAQIQEARAKLKELNQKWLSRPTTGNELPRPTTLTALYNEYRTATGDKVGGARYLQDKDVLSCLARLEAMFDE